MFLPLTFSHSKPHDPETITSYSFEHNLSSLQKVRGEHWHMTDPISDMLTRIRNAQMIRKAQVVVPYSKLKAALAEVLQREGFLVSVREQADGVRKMLILELRYASGGQPVISGLKRVSRPGQRIYRGYSEIPRALSGMGVTILSTSRGLLTDREARKEKIGGEVLCQIW
jgi:small subunit ribosomal protein S8